MSKKRQSETWREILYDTRGGASESVAQKRLQALERWRNPKDGWWLYLTADDIPDDPDETPKPIYWTVDERDDDAPVKPFPRGEEYLYLRKVGEEMWANRMPFTDKARQMLMSTFIAGLLDWYCNFNEERECIVSKVKQESAAKLINDKIRTPHRRKPKWLQAALPMDERPYDMITFGATGSTITAVAQNFAVSDARGITGSIIVVDEAAFQSTFRAIHRAVVPMANRLWPVTTAEIGNDGAAAFRELISETPYTDVVEHMPGLVCKTTPKGIRVIELDYWANPTHDEEWARKERKAYASEKDWRREMLRDWTSPAGDPYFPAWSELGGKATFVRQCTQLIGKTPTVFRSLDFGRRHPACTWFQFSPKSCRLWAIREWMPSDLLSHEFRDGVRYLSGEIPWEEVPPRAQAQILDWLAKPSASHCSQAPWFPRGINFINIGGKEANQSQSNVARPEDSVTADIFAAGDMPLHIVNPDVLGRNQLVGSLLRIRKDGWPGLLVDPQCEMLIVGFEGAFSYPKPTLDNPIPTTPKDDGLYINLLDAFGYGCAAVVPYDVPKDAPPPRHVGWLDGRTPLFESRQEGEEIAFYENRPQRSRRR